MLQVPAIWEDAAKATMRRAMEDAGLLRCGTQRSTASQHPLLIVLEPEAASIYCHVRARVLHRARVLYRAHAACQPSSDTCAATGVT